MPSSPRRFPPPWSAEELKEYYQAYTTGELPPQLLTLSKKLDEELLKKQEHSAVAF